MQCEGFPEENYGLFTLGGLEPRDAEKIRQHVREHCVTCERELLSARAVWAAVGSATPSQQPRRAVRKRLVQSIGGQVNWWERPWAALSLAALSFCALGLGWIVSQRGAAVPEIAFSPSYTVALPGVIAAAPRIEQAATPKPDATQTEAIAALQQDLARERDLRAKTEAELAQQHSLVAAQLATPKTATPPSQDDTQRRLAALTTRTQDLERQLTIYRTLLETQRKRTDQNVVLASLMSDPQLRLVKLRATEKGRAVEGHAIIAGGSQMAFFASALPALSAGRVYQLWLVRSSGQAIASAGLFSPDESKRAAVELKDANLLSGVTALAVTDEPAGGSTQPTGHKWLIGS